MFSTVQIPSSITIMGKLANFVKHFGLYRDETRQIHRKLSTIYVLRGRYNYVCSTWSLRVL
jgi:hypothetical protein